jgi:hypothetical protein
MSVLGRLGGDEYPNLPAILNEYQKSLDEADQYLITKGKTHAQANAEHASWQFFYDGQTAELRVLEKFFDMRVNAVRGRLFQKLSKATNIELSDRQREKYIDNDERYLKQYEVYLAVYELYDKFRALSEAFRARGFALRNLTEVKIISAQDDAI